jgi:hypothetical protein
MPSERKDLCAEKPPWMVSCEVGHLARMPDPIRRCLLRHLLSSRQPLRPQSAAEKAELEHWVSDTGGIHSETREMGL